jgi:DUF1016 N-terminal domain
MDIVKQNEYHALVHLISKTYTEGYATIVKTTHTVILNTYWEIGKYIVEYEQKGKPKAVYGLQLLANLAKDLILIHGKGFSRPNLNNNNMRMLYLRYPICQTLSDKLSWSHYIELIVLTRENNQMLVKYATYGMSSQLFVAKYQLYLPDESQLRQQLEHLLNDDSI